MLQKAAALSVIVTDWGNIRSCLNTTVVDVCFESHFTMARTSWQLTLVGTVGVGLVAVIPTVVVPVAGPVLWDAATAVAFKLDTRARMAAAGFIAVIAAVVVCRSRAHIRLKSSV